MPKHTISIINGPNLNLLGKREPEIYGHETLTDIESHCQQKAAELGYALRFNQSNSEGALVDLVQACMDNTSGLIINPGAYSHTSIAILDALQALTIPVIEVHLSNIHAREPFRQHSYVSKAATGVICGLGAQGYSLALQALGRHIS